MPSDVLQWPGEIEKQLTKGRYQEEHEQQIIIEDAESPTTLWCLETTLSADEGGPEAKHTVAVFFQEEY